MIRTDCYLAILKRMRGQYPTAHFEVITRTAHHILSPSRALLHEVKERHIDFEEYTKLLIVEFAMNAREIYWELVRLANLAVSQDVFLVCYEKDATHCHRSIVADLIKALFPPVGEPFIPHPNYDLFFQMVEEAKRRDEEETFFLTKEG